ncbi:MAG: nucleotidyltransferase family protein [Acidimicrobiales bacterium]|nr:nucleotidyltransferase family protein [Acidimicrobiales bacterium]
MAAGLELDRQAIALLCERFGVRRLSVFGSAVTGDFSPERSDVDFLVEFDPALGGRFDAYFGLKEELERLLGRPIDLVMPKALDNPYFAASVERSRRELFAA